MNKTTWLMALALGAFSLCEGASAAEVVDALTGKPVPTGHLGFARERREFAAELGMDSVRVELVLGKGINSGLDVTLSGSPKAAPISLGPRHQTDEHKYVDYGSRGRLEKSGGMPKSDVYGFSRLMLQTPRGSGWFGFDYYYLPYFDRSGGLYDHALVEASLPVWRKIYEPLETRKLVFRFEYDPAQDRTEAYLDNQYCGLVPGTGTVARVTGILPEEARMSCSWYRAAKRPARYSLPPLAHRASPRLKDGRASLVFADGKAPIEPWGIEESIDSGCHYRTTYAGGFGGNPFFARTPFEEGPEYLHWSVPPGAWLYAYVLCADLSEEGKVPVLGTRLTIFGQGNRDSVTEDFTDLSTAATNGNVRTVGKLKVKGEDGAWRETPLYLVRQRMSVDKILAVWNDKAIWNPNPDGTMNLLPRSMPFRHFDFEFIGAGSDSIRMKPWGVPASSVQIFGASLGKAPFGFDVSESERGNIFEEPEKPETGWDITAFEDGTKGSVAYRIYDDVFRPLRNGVENFSVAKAGETKRVSIDLSMPEVGWYGIDFTLKDEKGREVAVHRAAFTLLGKNDREAGYESPYAAWPQGTTYAQGRDGKWAFTALGRCNSNPDRFEVAKLMHKLGYHSAWSVPVSNEQECADWKLTLSAHSMFANPPSIPRQKDLTPEDIAVITNRIEAAVAWYREEHARYPHCKTIQILHECGGKELCKELRDGLPAVRAPYLAEKGAPGTFYITELAKRMRKEFPDCKLMLGNGSSASELIAHLVRDEGLDLNLVDELGIESKGFSSMPEIPDCLESPGMLWALRETGRIFGYSNLTVNACNEYVFRPERTVDESWSRARRMEVTAFTLRDYLISLAWGCRTISTGHLEDCFTPYYESSWGAGGQSKFYPYSYPKRMMTALSTFTKVFDRAKLSRRIPTGEISTYALEFSRDRKVKDFASAFWTPQHGAEIRIDTGKGCGCRVIDWQGREIEAKDGVLKIGPVPTYVVSDRPIAGVKVLRHFQDDLGADRAVRLASLGGGQGVHNPNLPHGLPWQLSRGDFGASTGIVGTWDVKAVTDPEYGPCLEARLIRDDRKLPVFQTEGGRIDIRDAKYLPKGFNGRIGIWVRGNGSFGKVVLSVRDERGRGDNLRIGYRGYACFDGWALMVLETKGTVIEKFKDQAFRPAELLFSTQRQTLNPIELVQVEKPIAFGDIVLLPPEETSRSYEVDASRSAEALKYVPEKDL